MVVFLEKPGRAPPNRVLSRLSDRFVTTISHTENRFRSDFFLVLTQEQERLGLWAPVAMAAGIAIYFALPNEPYFAWALVAVLATAFCAFRWRAKNGWALLAIGLFALAFGFQAATLRTALVAAPNLAHEMKGVNIEGRVLEASANENGGLSLILAPDRITGLTASQLPARVRLKVSQKETDLWPGDSIKTRALLWPPSEPVAPGAFDFARQAYFQRLGGTGVTLAAPEITDRSEAANWQIAIDRIRETVARRVMEKMGPETGPVAAALMTGQRQAISDETVQNLRDSGLAHILAISGLHMALFAGTLFWLMRAGLALVPYLALRYPLKKWAAITALIGALAYLLLSGGAVATQRAFIMAALMFLSILLDRPAFSLRNVSLAALIILTIRPESLLEPGFQMSFAAVTALIAVYQNRELQLLRVREGATGVSGLLRLGFIYVATLSVTSLVAGAATAPFAAFHFNRMAVFGVVGNLLAMPLVGALIMPAALIAYILMPFGLDAPALWVMEWGLEGLLWAAATVAGWDGAIVNLPAMSEASLVWMAMGGLWLALWKTRARYAGIGLIVVGTMLAHNYRQPDILVDADAKLVVVRQMDGRYLWSGVSPRYTAQTWARRNAEANEDTPRLRQMTCDGLGCTTIVGSTKVAVARSIEALSDDCREADILIALIPARRDVRRTCNAGFILDRFDIARNGAHALYLDESGSGKITHVETVKRQRGNRPWTGTLNTAAADRPDAPEP